MSVHLRAKNSDILHTTTPTILIKMLSVHQRASDTVKFNTMCLYKKILSIEQKPRLCHYVIKFLFINLIMTYQSLKNMCLHKTCLLT